MFSSRNQKVGWMNLKTWPAAGTRRHAMKGNYGNFIGTRESFLLRDFSRNKFTNSFNLFIPQEDSSCPTELIGFTLKFIVPHKKPAQRGRERRTASSHSINKTGYLLSSIYKKEKKNFQKSIRLINLIWENFVSLRVFSRLLIYRRALVLNTIQKIFHFTTLRSLFYWKLRLSSRLQENSSAER